MATQHSLSFHPWQHWSDFSRHHEVLSTLVFTLVLVVPVVILAAFVFEAFVTNFSQVLMVAAFSAFAVLVSLFMWSGILFVVGAIFSLLLGPLSTWWVMHRR